MSQLNLAKFRKNSQRTQEKIAKFLCSTANGQLFWSIRHQWPNNEFKWSAEFSMLCVLQVDLQRAKMVSSGENSSRYRLPEQGKLEQNNLRDPGK